MVSLENFKQSVSAGIESFREWYMSKSLPTRIILALAGLLFAILDVVLIVYHQKILDHLINISDVWEERGFEGQLIFVLLILLVSFPPMIGYTMILTVAGIVYGYKSFPLLALSSAVGSTMSFYCFKKLFKEKSALILESNTNLKLFAGVLKDSETSFINETFMLTLMKIMPLPYSLTNGSLGCIPNLSPWAFFCACLIASPKIYVNLFMGVQMRKIGSDKGSNEKWIDFSLILFTGLSFFLITFFIYRKVKQRIIEFNEERGVELDLSNRDEEFVI
ncbi:Tvp38 protein [Martiniozyma asiatica (nom. inval.)]|nr:Tvp38 protein [Martiniozyma asiatica]